VAKTWTLVAWALPALLIGGVFYLVTRKAVDSSGPTLPVRDPRAILGTMADAGAAGVDPNARPSTVDRIVGLEPPSGVRQSDRVSPFETSLWKVEATVEQVEIRSDGDIYLVISSPKGARTVAESPPSASGPFRNRIQSTRDQLVRELHPSGQPKAVRRRAVLIGVGFFGRPSKVSNGARLSPLVEIKWID
jgi:hypothetical protein